MPICSGAKELDLRALLAALREEDLGLLEAVVTFDRLAEELALLEGDAVRRGDDADRALRHDRLLDLVDAEEERMDLEGSVREEPQLLAADAAVVEERRRILEVVVRAARLVLGVDAARRHRLAVGRRDHTEFIRGDRDELELADHAHEGPRDDVQARRQIGRLNADLSIRGERAARRQTLPGEAPLGDHDFA